MGKIQKVYTKEFKEEASIFADVFHTSANMSRKGKCRDNVVIESFFVILKDECLKATIYSLHDKACIALFTCMGVHYNWILRHPTLEYANPFNYGRMDNHRILRILR